MSQRPDVESDSAPLRAYANNSTLRGVALLAVGLFALAAPRASEFLLGVAVALGLVALGLIDIRAGWRAKPKGWIGMAIGFVYIATAVVLVVLPNQTVRLISLVLAAVLIVRGLLGAWRAIRARATRPTWTYEMITGFLFAAVGVILLLVPETIVTGAIFAFAGAAIIAGAISLSVGIMVAHDVEVDPNTEITTYLKEWFDRRDVGEEMRDQVVDSLFFEPPDSLQKQVGFWTLLVLSTAIATLGIIADSTAVVIGAMLVAPLMTPIMGVSVAVVNGWPRRVATAFATVAGGVAVSVGVAWILTAWVPQLVPIASNTQIQSRIAPTLIDLLIAVAAGAAGAYATIDKRVSSSITGVAIAVALVPPLGVVGITLNSGTLADASGAFLLFLTNLVGIILVASVVFVVAGLVPVSEFKKNREKTRTVISTVALGALVITVPLFFTSEGIIASATRQSTVQSITEVWLEDAPDISLDKVTIDVDDVTVELSGEGDVPSVADLEADLEDRFKTNVTVVVNYFPSIRLTSDNQ